MKMLFLKVMGFAAVLTVVTADAARVSVGWSAWLGNVATRMARAMDAAEARQRQLMAQQQAVAQQRLAALQPALRQRIIQGVITPDLLVNPVTQEALSALNAVKQSEELLRDMRQQRQAAEWLLPTLDRQRAQEIVAGFEQHGALFRAPELLQRESVTAHMPLQTSQVVVGQGVDAAYVAQLQDEQARLQARLAEIEAELALPVIADEQPASDAVLGR